VRPVTNNGENGVKLTNKYVQPGKIKGERTIHAQQVKSSQVDPLFDITQGWRMLYSLWKVSRVFERRNEMKRDKLVIERKKKRP